MEELNVEKFKEELSGIKVFEKNWTENIKMVMKLSKSLGIEEKIKAEPSRGPKILHSYIGSVLENVTNPDIIDFYQYKTLENLSKILKENNDDITKIMMKQVFCTYEAPDEKCYKNVEKNIEKVYTELGAPIIKIISKKEGFKEEFLKYMRERYGEHIKERVNQYSSKEGEPISADFYYFYEASPKFKKIIEKTFEEEIEKYKKFMASEIKSGLINRIKTIVNFFDRCGYLDEIIEINNKSMQNMGLDFLEVKKVEDKEKFNIMNLTSEKYLEQFDIGELFILGAYYSNRFEKVLGNVLDGMYLQEKFDIFYETFVEGEIPRKFDLDDAKIVLKQKRFLDTLANENLEKLEGEADLGYEPNEEDFANVPKEFAQKYAQIYKEYFDRYIPTSQNELEEDYKSASFDRMASYLMYALKDFSIESFLYTLSENKSKINFGIVKENRTKYNEYGEKQILIGVDAKEFTPIMLHLPEETLKKFDKILFPDGDFSNYIGNEDLYFRGSPIKTHIAYKYTKTQKQKIKKLYENMDKKSQIYPYVRHMYWNIHPAKNPLNNKKILKSKNDLDER